MMSAVATEQLTEAQKACNYETFRHIERVRNLLNECARRLMIKRMPSSEAIDEMTLLDHVCMIWSGRSFDMPVHLQRAQQNLISYSDEYGLSPQMVKLHENTLAQLFEEDSAARFHFVADLLKRGELHDQSKLESPEVELFTEFTPKLAGVTYGSDEYVSYLAEMKPALDHHYANNRHHPEFHKHGIDDMNLADIVEMLCDWKAASERHHDGNIRKSIQHNTERFGMSSQLVKAMENTVTAMF